MPGFGRPINMPVVNRGLTKVNCLFVVRRTYGNQSAIVIVDGIERDMSYLAPDEIETFTILKDASATILYGSRASNGVIVIETTAPKAGN